MTLTPSCGVLAGLGQGHQHQHDHDRGYYVADDQGTERDPSSGLSAAPDLVTCHVSQDHREWRENEDRKIRHQAPALSSDGKARTRALNVTAPPRTRRL